MSYTPVVNANTLTLYLGIAAAGRATASSTALTDVHFGTPYAPSSVTFDPSDVGMPIAISGGGPVDADMPPINQIQGGLFVTTIAAYVSPTAVTLTAAPNTSYYNAGFANVVLYRPCPFASDVANVPVQFQYSSSIAPGTSDTLQFSVLNELGGALGVQNPYITRFGGLKLGQPVYLVSSDGAVGDIFGGYIDTLTTSSQPGLSGPYCWSAQCASWTGLAKRRIVPPATPQTFVAVAGDEVFRKIVLDYLVDDGVSVTTSSAPTITLACPVGANIGQLLDQVVGLISTNVTAWYWYVDPWRNFVLTTRTGTAAPWSITNGDDLLAGDTPYLQSIQQTHNQMANFSYAIASAALLNTLNVTFTGDGSTTVFNVPAPAGAQPVITLNAVSQSVGYLGVDVGFDWYWSQGSTAITQDSGGAVLISTDVLVVSYTPEAPAVAQAPNVQSLQQLQAVEGTSANYDHSFTVSQPILPADLLALATAYETEYGLPATTCQLYTLRPGLKTGQLQSIALADAGIPSGNYLIATLQMSLNNNVIEWQYTAFGGANIGDSITALVQFINREQAVGLIVIPTVPIQAPAVPINPINKNSGLAGNAGSQPLPFPSNVTKGNLLVVVAARNNMTIPPVVTDSQGNSYTLAVFGANVGLFPNRVAILYTFANANGPCAVTSTDAWFITIAEIANIDSTNPVDVVQANSVVPPTITVAHANNVVVTGMCMDSSVVTPTVHAPEVLLGFSLNGISASDNAGSMEVVGAGSFTSTLTTTATNRIYVSVSFNRAPATAPPPQTVNVIGNPTGGVDVTTKGDLQGFSTVPDRVPVGADGTVLTADSTNPLGVSYKPGGASGLSLLETQTVTNAAEIDFTAWFSSTYNVYKIVLEGIVSVSSGQDIGLQMSTSGGTSYDTGSNYAWDNWAFTPAGAGNNGSNSDTLMVLLVALTTVTDTVGSGEYAFYNPGSAAAFKNVTGNGFCLSANDGRMAEGLSCAASYLVTTAVNAFRVKARSGNITGTVRVYGLAN